MNPDGEARFSEFVAARQQALLRTAYLLTSDRHSAEDCCVDIQDFEGGESSIEGLLFLGQDRRGIHVDDGAGRK